jgi:hypothetical protein
VWRVFVNLNSYCNGHGRPSGLANSCHSFCSFCQKNLRSSVPSADGPHPKSTLSPVCEGLIRVENGLAPPIHRPVTDQKSGPKIRGYKPISNRHKPKTACINKAAVNRRTPGASRRISLHGHAAAHGVRCFSTAFSYSHTERIHMYSSTVATPCDSRRFNPIQSYSNLSKPPGGYPFFHEISS